jgi:hypothetical protein
LPSRSHSNQSTKEEALREPIFSSQYLVLKPCSTDEGKKGQFNSDKIEEEERTS